MSPRAGRRARASKPELVTIFWRDIPAQVTASSGDDRVKVLLDARFQHAIDRAAMVAGKSDTQSYVAEWRREVKPFDGDPQTAADAEAEQVNAAYDADTIEALVRSGGVAEAKPAGTDENAEMSESKPAPVDDA